MSTYEIAKNTLFSNGDVTEESAIKSLNLLNSREIDFGDLFFERTVSESFSLEEGIVKGGSFSIS